jgi:putative ABC transport system permease protein
LIHRLVFENLKHRPVRTLFSAIAIGVSVTMILTLVGVSQGVLGDIADRSLGTGADITIRPPNSTVLSLSSNIPHGEKIVALVRQQPHVALATGVLTQSAGDAFTFITGIHLDEVNQMSGGFRYIDGAGCRFQRPDDLIVDEEFAQAKNLHVGSAIKLGTSWHVCAVIESGVLSHMFAEIDNLRDLYSATGAVSVIYVKVDRPENIESVKAELLKTLNPERENSNEDGFKVYTMKEFTALLTVNNYPLLKNFTNVVIGVAALWGLLVVFQTMYTAVLERTREIGILKALGASPGYILGILMREAVLLAVVGTVAGIVMTFGTRLLMHRFAPTMAQKIVPDWWWRAGLISLTGAVLGALYPGLKAARQDAIEALAYD